MALDSLAVWPIAPDWSGEITETLEFLTGVLASPIGAEQRISFRLTPRRSFEMTFKPVGPIRTLFDLFMQRASGSDIWLPLWHDSNRLTVAEAAGSTVLNIGSTAYTEFADCPGAILYKSPFDYEIVEHSSVNSTQILLSGATVNDWPIRSRIFPLQRVRIEQQPSTARKASFALETRVKFSCDAANPTSATITIPTFNDHYVLEREPNDVSDLSYIYDRLLAELDNQTGRRTRNDLNQWGITTQQFAFFLRGRADHAWVRALFYTLAGRRLPIFVPTFYRDIEVVAPITASTVVIKRCGITDFGPPFRGREYITIVLRDGTRLYNRIISSALIGDGTTEQLTLETAVVGTINPLSISRVSFLPLSRLDQDSIEIVHHTDTKGLATCTTIFRTIPQTRNPIPDPDSDLGKDGESPPPLYGSIYFEMTPIVCGTNAGFGGGGYSVCIGLADASFILDNPHELNFNTDDPDLANGVFWSFLEDLDGVGWSYPTRAAGGPFLAAVHDVIGIAVDFESNQIWLKNVTRNSAWTGKGSGTPDPTTKTDGFSFSPSGSSPITGDICILGGVGRDPSVPAPVLNVNFSGTFAGLTPSGYTAAGGTFNPSDKAPDDMTTGPKIILSNGNKTITAGVIPGVSQPTAFVRSTNSWIHGA